MVCDEEAGKVLIFFGKRIQNTNCVLFVRNLNYSTRKANTHATQKVESEKLFVKWKVI